MLRTDATKYFVVAAACAAGATAYGQAGAKATDNLPNPYQTVENFFKLPDGRSYGAVSAIEIDKDGKSLWVAERCGGNSECVQKPTVDPVVLFDSTGKVVRSWGAGKIASPHGIY